MNELSEEFVAEDLTTQVTQEKLENDQVNHANQIKHDSSSIENLISAKISELEKSEYIEEEEERKFEKSTKKQAKELKKFLSDILNDSECTKEEKLKGLFTKYYAMLHERRLIEREFNLKARKVDELIKEKDAIYNDLARMNIAKVRLENLCRELQKQHKVAKESTRRLAENEQHQREELSKELHDKIQEIKQKLEEQAEERRKSYKENEMLKEKLRNFVEQYEIR